MSKKPLKHSEQKAIAEKMARKHRLSEAIFELPPRTMIFCEGTKTEPNYLTEIADLIYEKYRKYSRNAE